MSVFMMAVERRVAISSWRCSAVLQHALPLVRIVAGPNSPEATVLDRQPATLTFRVLHTLSSN
jgi:hypothetical protein